MQEHIQLFTRLGIALTIAVVGFVLATLARMGVKRLFQKVKGDKSIISFMGQTLFWLVFGAFFIAALNQSGLYTTSLVAALGAILAALILAMQSTLGNFASGVILLFQRPFRVGDTIACGGIEGVVTDMNIVYTFIDLGDKIGMIPNSQLLASPIIKQRQK